MMFKATDLRAVKFPGVLYRLDLYMAPTKRDIYALENACRRYQKQYPYVSWFIAISTTKTHADKVYRYAGEKRVKNYRTYSRRSPQKTGKRGRPKMVVDGERTSLHIHQGAVGSGGQSANTFQKKVAVAMNKRYGGKKVASPKSMKGAAFIAYCYEQADSFHTGGDFDFRQCITPDFYLVEE